MKKMLLLILLIPIALSAQTRAEVHQAVMIMDSLQIGEDSWIEEIEFGSDVFTTTAEADTVLISGALAVDKYLLQMYGTAADPQDVLTAEAKEDTLIVHRPANGSSAGTYHWWRFK